MKLVFITLTIFLFFHGNTALACRYLYPEHEIIKNSADIKKIADMIFIGKVILSKETSNSSEKNERYLTEFRVLKSYKGLPPYVTQIQLYTEHLFLNKKQSDEENNWSSCSYIDKSRLINVYMATKKKTNLFGSNYAL